MRVASVIPVHNRRQVTLNCLERLDRAMAVKPEARTVDMEYRIIVVDDGSTDGTAEAVCRLFPEVVLIKGDGNLWWTGAVNRGVRYCLENGFDYIHIMNDDIDFEPDFLARILACARNDAIIGSVTLYADRKAVIFKAGMNATGKPHPRVVDWHKNAVLADIRMAGMDAVDGISGRSMLVPYDVFQRIGLFNEKRLPHGYADMMFCLRAKKRGIRTYVNFDSRIYTAPSPGKSLTAVLKSSRKAEFARSLFNIKYGWHIPSLFFFNVLERNLLQGVLGFFHHGLIILKWAFIKMMLPKKRLVQYVDNHLWK